MALQRLSGDRRMVCVIAPVIIGFLPSAGAVNICGAIEDKATGKDLDVEEKTFVTSYYRHISESFSPTYNAILLALSRSFRFSMIRCKKVTRIKLPTTSSVSFS